MKISEVFHKTFLALNEGGTEAASVTLGDLSLGAELPRKEPVEIRVDHPFLFAIQHRETGMCLFFGRVTDPR